MVLWFSSRFSIVYYNNYLMFINVLGISIWSHSSLIFYRPTTSNCVTNHQLILRTYVIQLSCPSKLFIPCSYRMRAKRTNIYWCNFRTQTYNKPHTTIQVHHKDRSSVSRIQWILAIFRIFYNSQIGLSSNWTTINFIFAK